MPTLRLTSEEESMLGGEAGPAAQLAARLVVRMAGIMGADRLVPIVGAHVDSCLYHGPVSTDFAKKLVDGGGKVKVPTTLNVGSVDLLHPELYRGDAETARAGRELMRLYTALGCRATWTCAPYQLQQRPSFGEHVAWAESNAIVFANSVLGARTERYGDFIDIAAGLIGRAPYAGLHRDDGRFARVVFRLRDITPALAESDVLFATLGHLIGRRAGGDIAAIDGISHATEDQLKALGAAAASSGSVAMFHVIGVTPEAPTMAEACGGRGTIGKAEAIDGSSASGGGSASIGSAPRIVELTMDDLAAAARELSSAAGDDETLGAISVGTPHFSIAEFEQLVTFLDGRRVSDRVEFFVSTGRDVLTQVTANGWLDDLTRAGVRIVTDTCTYITPILTGRPGAVMTNSAKWAWYAPNNLGLRVIFGSLRECVESAVRGEVWRDASLWSSSPHPLPPLPQERGDFILSHSSGPDDFPEIVSAAENARADSHASDGGVAEDRTSVDRVDRDASDGIAVEGVALTSGRATATVLVLDEPLSFWGGVDATSGAIVDTHHPQVGQSVAGRILMLHSGRGSSSSSSVLAETIRNRVGPAAILIVSSDPILALGCLVAEELYGIHVPVVVLDETSWRICAAAATLKVDAGEGRAMVAVV